MMTYQVTKLEKQLTSVVFYITALWNEGRMSCHISIKELTPFHVGALMYFFFLTIAYEGAMENVNAFDQPGVEDYKKILHEDLRKYIVKNQALHGNLGYE